MKTFNYTILLLPAYFFIFCLFLLWRNQNYIEPTKLNSITETRIYENSEMPINIYIPRFELEVKIVDGDYQETTKEWNVSKNYAHFATVTNYPNESSGLTLIYGHNTKNVFGDLSKLEVGDNVKVTTKNEKEFNYKMTDSKEVNPYDTSIFDYNGESTLALLTCSGIADQKRTIYYLKLN